MKNHILQITAAAAIAGSIIMLSITERGPGSANAHKVYNTSNSGLQAADRAEAAPLPEAEAEIITSPAPWGISG